MKHPRDIIHFYTPQGGRRRMYIWAGSLRTLLQQTTTHHGWLEWIQQTPLRPGKDYLIAMQNHDLRLTLSAAQALLVLVGTNHSWALHHQIADTIQNGFNQPKEQ